MRNLKLKDIKPFYYVFLFLAIVIIVGLSCVALLSQAVRTAPNRGWPRNLNALVIGATYVLIVRLHHFLVIMIQCLIFYFSIGGSFTSFHPKAKTIGQTKASAYTKI